MSLFCYVLSLKMTSLLILFRYLSNGMSLYHLILHLDQMQNVSLCLWPWYNTLIICTDCDWFLAHGYLNKDDLSTFFLLSLVFPGNVYFIPKLVWFFQKSIVFFYMSARLLHDKREDQRKGGLVGVHPHSWCASTLRVIIKPGCSRILLFDSQVVHARHWSQSSTRTILQKDNEIWL